MKPTLRASPEHPWRGAAPAPEKRRRRVVHSALVAIAPQSCPLWGLPQSSGRLLDFHGSHLGSTVGCVRPALVRSTRRRRFAGGTAVGAFLLGSMALAGCNTPVITGLANPPAGPASSDPLPAPAPPTTVDPPSAVPPAASPTPAAVLPPPEPVTTCADHDYRNADGAVVDSPPPPRR
ncbi:MAG: hypothetical protein ACRDQU_12730 [Pseudonocardiaceae bacterium]